MTIALQYCNITVNDVDESIAFYGDALGLQVRSDVPSGDFRWVTLGAEVLQKPIDQSWGPRDCAFRDPSGNTVRIAQAPAS